MPQLDKYCIMVLMTLTTFIAIYAHFVFTGLAAKLRNAITVRKKLIEYNQRYLKLQEYLLIAENRKRITDKYFTNRFANLKKQMDSVDARLKKEQEIHDLEKNKK